MNNTRWIHWIVLFAFLIDPAGFFFPAPTDRPKKRLRRRSKNGGSGSATLSKVTCKAVRFLCKKPVVKVLNVTLV